MSTQKRRIQRAKKNQKIAVTATIVICALILAAIVSLFFYESSLKSDDDRIFFNGENNVTLRPDGTFVAFLPHNTRFSGTFEQTNTTIAFNYNGRTDFGTIHENILTVPNAWEVFCGHGHGLIYTMR
jgi:hypothetical protein